MHLNNKSVRFMLLAYSSDLTPQTHTHLSPAHVCVVILSRAECHCQGEVNLSWHRPALQNGPDWTPELLSASLSFHFFFS